MGECGKCCKALWSAVVRSIDSEYLKRADTHTAARKSLENILFIDSTLWWYEIHSNANRLLFILYQTVWGKHPLLTLHHQKQSRQQTLQEMERRLWQCSKKFMSWVKICDINVEILYTKWTLAGIYGHGVSAAISSSILYTKFRPSILLQWTSLHGPLRWLHLPSWMTSLFGSSLVWLRGNWTRTLQPLSGPLRTETDTHRQQLVPEISFSSYMRPCDAFQELTFVWLMLPQLVSACLFDPELFPTSLKISRTTRGRVRPRCIQRDTCYQNEWH